MPEKSSATSHILSPTFSLVILTSLCHTFIHKNSTSLLVYIFPLFFLFSFSFVFHLSFLFCILHDANFLFFFFTNTTDIRLSTKIQLDKQFIQVQMHYFQLFQGELLFDQKLHLQKLDPVVFYFVQCKIQKKGKRKMYAKCHMGIVNCLIFRHCTIYFSFTSAAKRRILCSNYAPSIAIFHILLKIMRTNFTIPTSFIRIIIIHSHILHTLSQISLPITNFIRKLYINHRRKLFASQVI